MNREIKFRAWDSYCKEMKHLSNRHIYYWEDDELMQYTGLVDKKGIEIYEGDIVECVSYHGEGLLPAALLGIGMNYTYSSTKDAVIFDNACFGVRDASDVFVPLVQFADVAEVIGNIYQHPKLLTPASGIAAVSSEAESKDIQA